MRCNLFVAGVCEYSESSLGEEITLPRGSGVGGEFEGGATFVFQGLAQGVVSDVLRFSSVRPHKRRKSCCNQLRMLRTSLQPFGEIVTRLLIASFKKLQK